MRLLIEKKWVILQCVENLQNITEELIVINQPLRTIFFVSDKDHKDYKEMV